MASSTQRPAHSKHSRLGVELVRVLASEGGPHLLDGSRASVPRVRDPERRPRPTGYPVGGTTYQFVQVKPDGCARAPATRRGPHQGIPFPRSDGAAPGSDRQALDDPGDPARTRGPMKPLRTRLEEIRSRYCRLSVGSLGQNRPRHVKRGGWYDRLECCAKELTREPTGNLG